MADDTIATWSPTILTKFIRDLLTNQPPSFLPLLKAENVSVSDTLTIRDKLALTKEPRFRQIGGTGQAPFTNSWTNFGSGWQTAAFWRMPDGWVHLRGLIKSGTIGSSAFTLPPGYRPVLSEPFVCISNGAVGRVDVLTDGTVVPSVGNNTYVTLSGISFRTT